ncbi:MAG: hypothetical protein AUI50_08325 [Crenarchaeota archaeon 13_1_40CM_2_52_14]|nr:MAG: hypothetical protein AUI50_08325 [Crenarchaeota archaeon 13_1_40CM_2_52_14]
MPCLIEIAWVPVDEALEVYERRSCSLRTQRRIVTGGGCSTILGSLPVMIYLRMNSTITRRI